ncbi:MAG: Fic family protein [Clostridia bacterium]|jgi:Fic family protein
MSFNPIYPYDQLEILPPKDKTIENKNFFDILLKARVELAELKGYCGQIPNPLLLISPEILRESIASSDIENINTTLINVLQGQLFPEEERRAPDKEVLRYKEALLWGFENIKKFGLSTRTILGIQKKLIPDSFGQYRKSQNQIINSRTKEALYTPPSVENIPRLINNWENYVNTKSQEIDPLICAAISHYQFESIHPFGDGNGRTGRILIVLQLVNNDILSLPILYISGYINDNRSEYYRLLRDITIKDNWREYIEFMLNGFYLQAKETKENLQKLIALFNETKSFIKTKHPKIYSNDLVEALFSYPIISPTKLATLMDMHYTTTSKYLIELANSQILKESKIGRHHLYINDKLIKIFDKNH